MLPFMFGKRPACTRDETNLEESLLDLQIRGALLAEYGNVRPPAGVFQRVMLKIRSWEGSKETGARTRTATAIFGAMRALYRNIRSAASGSAASRLMPAAMALILLVVVADVNFQHLTGSTGSRGSATSPQFVSNGNQAEPAHAPTGASLTGGTVDPGWYEPDPDLRYVPWHRVTDQNEGADRGNQQGGVAANGAQSTVVQWGNLSEQKYLTSGPY